MNVLKIFVPILFLFLSSCCTNVSKNEKINRQTKINKSFPASPTTITDNQSIITARVEELNVSDKNNYSIDAMIVNVDENPAYQNMAVKGNVYKLFPNYILNDDKEIDFSSHQENNQKLRQLSQLKKGDEFRAIIFMGKGNKWYIQKVLK